MTNPEVIFPHIGIEIEHLPRTLFSVAGFPIYFYGVCIALGMLAGVCYGVVETKRTGQDMDFYYNYLLFAIVACIIGARAYYVIFDWQLYQDDWLSIFAIRKGGLAIYGGVIVAVVSAVWYNRRKGASFWLFADTGAPGLILGQAIGRWGNFFNREAFGGNTDSFFAMAYLEKTVYAIPKAVAGHAVEIGGAPYIQVHPTFLYEFALCIGVFIIMNIYKYHKKADGEIFALYLIGYGIGRFFIEGLRTDQLFLWGTEVPVSQVVSLLLVALGVGIAGYGRKKAAGRKDPAA